MASSKKYKKTYNSRTLWGKLRVSRMLSKDSATVHLVPRATAFSLKNLKKMAASFDTLYIKPDIGSLGIGIHRLRPAEGGYELMSVGSRHKQKVKILGTLDAVYKHINKTKQPGKMLIQRGIRLDQAAGKTYDIRAMVQRRPKGAWTCTAVFAKVAPLGRIVTNVHQGAKLYMLPRLWEMQGLSEAAAKANSTNVESSALTVSKSLSRRYHGMHEMGIDFAIDRVKKLWVLEVNTNHPQFKPIKKVDRAAYNRIASFARSYGRMDD